MARRRSGRRGRRQKGLSVITEYAVGGIPVATTLAVSKDAFQTVPNNRPFRILSVSYSFGMKKGASAIVVLRLYASEETEAVSDSGPLLVTTAGLRGRLIQRDKRWYPDNLGGKVTLMAIDNICQSKDDLSTVRVVLRLHILLGPEVFNEKCPASLLWGTPREELRWKEEDSVNSKEGGSVCGGSERGEGSTLT